MSARNGDRARFQKDRRRKLRLRQRIQALRVALRERAEAKPETRIPVVTRIIVNDDKWRDRMLDWMKWRRPTEKIQLNLSRRRSATLP
jgi:hypothetical protein